MTQTTDERTGTDETERHAGSVGSVATIVGPAVAIAAAGILSDVRDDVGITNVALALAVIVVLASIAGRAAGIVTALIAAASYNFFHAQPYHSLRIHDGEDVLTVVMLLAIGLVISAVASLRRGHQRVARRRLHGEQVLVTMSGLLASGAPSDAIWTFVHDELVRDLRLGACRYEPRPTTDVPVVGRTGSLPGTALRLGEHGFDLPTTGAAIDVVAAGRSFGRIVLVPTSGSDAGSASLREQRRVAVALADLFAVALDRAERTDGSAVAIALEPHISGSHPREPDTTARPGDIPT